MKTTVFLLALLPGCEFTLRIGDAPRTVPTPVRPELARRSQGPIPNADGHDDVDRLGGWDAIEKKRREATPEEYRAWLEEHRHSQDGPPIGNGG